MNPKPASLLPALAIGSILSAASSFAATVSVTDGDSNNYGNFDGFALDFDASIVPNADYTPDLINGGLYSIDSISLFDRNSFNSDFYLGVYTGLSGSTLSGFQGVSSNTVNFSAQGDEKVTWVFNGFTVTPGTNPGSGTDIRYFILQTGTEALATVPNIGDNNTQVKRIDGETVDVFDDYLSAVIDGSLNDDRSVEYEAALTLIPEPGTAGLAALGLAVAALRRRKTC